MKSDIKLKLVVVRGKNEWLLEVLRPLESVTKPSLSDPSFFYKIRLKKGVFYRIGLKGVFSSFGYSN